MSAQAEPTSLSYWKASSSLSRPLVPEKLKQFAALTSVVAAVADTGAVEAVEAASTTVAATTTCVVTTRTEEDEAATPTAAGVGVGIVVVTTAIKVVMEDRTTDRHPRSRTHGLRHRDRISYLHPHRVGCPRLKLGKVVIEDMVVHLFHRRSCRDQHGWATRTNRSMAVPLPATRPVTTRFRTSDSTDLLMRSWEGVEEVAVIAGATVDIRAIIPITTALLATIGEVVVVAGDEVVIVVVVAAVATTMEATGLHTTLMTTARDLLEEAE